MSWAHGIINGREVGYGVAAKCDHSDCGKDIDRGLAYLCGDLGGQEFGCGGYFCYEHLLLPLTDDAPAQLCPKCFDEWTNGPVEDRVPARTPSTKDGT